MTSPDDIRARRIRRWIRQRERRVLARFPVLTRQNAIGLSLCLGSAAGMTALGVLYGRGVVPVYVCILGCAFLASILHEIEHDLIHRLYFRNRPWVHHMMMFIVWAFRGNVPHGWYRRGIHYRHHAASGTSTDIEERLLGLGTAWGPRRLLVSIDGLMAFALNGRRLEREVPGFRRFDLALAAVPFYPIYLGVLILFAAYHAELALGRAPSATLEAFYPTLAVFAAAWVFPNYLRQAALQIVSSNVHYYEDVGGLHEETQILRPAYLWPLQLFCFNFGTTHSFHHYVVEQPFYIRQLIAPSVVPYLRRSGVRENDTGTFWRANRFRLAS